jgi:membrane-bound lytic murein transglycosylase B
MVITACATDATVSSAVETAQPRPTPAVRYTPVPTLAPSAAVVTAAPAPTATATPINFKDVPIPAGDAVSLAAQLAMAESLIRDPKATDDQIVWAGHMEQLALGTLADFPDWKSTVLAALPANAKTAIQGSMEAGKQLRSMNGAIPTRLPDWKIVEAAPTDELITYYKEAEAQFGVGWQYLAAIHLVETRMGRIRGLSSAGAQGPMQFMPATWAQYGRGDVNNNRDAIMGAARYLVAAGAPGNMQKALFAYNHAQAYVNALIAYADVMKGDPMAYRGYHGWQVYYPTIDGSIYMPAGWTKP